LRATYVPDDLYERYMAASCAYRDHTRKCADCASASEAHCAAGRRLQESLGRLQDAYLNRLKKK
jgi:hypothetical protein